MFFYLEHSSNLFVDSFFRASALDLSVFLEVRRGIAANAEDGMGWDVRRGGGLINSLRPCAGGTHQSKERSGGS